MPLSASSLIDALFSIDALVNGNGIYGDISHRCPFASIDALANGNGIYGGIPHRCPWPSIDALLNRNGIYGGVLDHRARSSNGTRARPRRPTSPTRPREFAIMHSCPHGPPPSIRVMRPEVNHGARQFH